MTKSQWSSGNHIAKRSPIQPAKSGADPIATGLQQLFAPLAAEPIPDEFMALLDRIDANARVAGTTSASESASSPAQIGTGSAK